MVVEVEVVEPGFHILPVFRHAADALGEEFNRFHVAIRTAFVVPGAPLLYLPRRAFDWRVLGNPREDFAIAFSGGEFSLQRFGRDAGEKQPMMVDRVVVFVFTGGAGEFRLTLVEEAGEEDVAAQAHAWAAGRPDGKVGGWNGVFAHARGKDYQGVSVPAIGETRKQSLFSVGLTPGKFHIAIILSSGNLPPLLSVSLSVSRHGKSSGGQWLFGDDLKPDGREQS